MTQMSYDRQNPAYYALIVALVMMSLAPIMLMLMTSFKLNVQIMDDTAGLFFVPTLQNYERVLCNVLPYAPAHVEYCDPTFEHIIIFIKLYLNSETLKPLIIF